MSDAAVLELLAIAALAEQKVGDAQEAVDLAAADLSRLVGPLAAAHRLAELGVEYFALAKTVGDDCGGLPDRQEARRAPGPTGRGKS